MLGLTVRWSLVGCPAGTLTELASYVESTSYDRFGDLDGLRFKTWRARAGEWFEGTYVFETDAHRADFQASFEAKSAEAPASLVVGSPPILSRHGTLWPWPRARPGSSQRRATENRW